MAVNVVVSSADAGRLAGHLRDAGRDRVVVVVSTRGTDGAVMFDAEAVSVECGNRADVWVVPSGHIGLDFSDLLPDMGRVYGGAARVYPKGAQWVTQPLSSPLFFAYDAAEAERRIDSLIDSAIEASYVMAPEPDYPNRGSAVAEVLARVFAPGGPRPSPASVAGAFKVTATSTPAPELIQPVSASAVLAPLPSAPAPVPRPRPQAPALVHRVPPADAEKRAASAAPTKAVMTAATAALAEARAEARALRMEYEQDRLGAEIEIATLRKRLSDQQELHRERTQAARKRRGALESGPAVSVWAPELFMVAEDTVRHAITVAWVERVPAAEKSVYALPDYDVGPDFAESIDALPPAQQAKAFKCVVDVLTDRAREIASRRVHPLRKGAGGDNSPHTRENGAVCFRANIETSTASARRLHWWRNSDGSIELSRVVVHDDMGV